MEQISVSADSVSVMDRIVSIVRQREGKEDYGVAKFRISEMHVHYCDLVSCPVFFVFWIVFEMEILAETT